MRNSFFPLEFFRIADQYDRIIDLHLNGISPMNFNRLIEFLKQFPHLRFLHLAIQNRRISTEILIGYLNDIIQTCQSLINLNIQLDDSIELSISSEDLFNPRTKMRFTDVIFDGIIMHLWF